MARLWWARESVGFLVSIQLVDAAEAEVDLTGWTFAVKFARQKGSVDVTLGMAGSAAAEGFYLTDPTHGIYQVRILAATLAGISDTTGDFTMFGDIVATMPSGQKLWIEDIEFQVTEGVTT